MASLFDRNRLGYAILGLTNNFSYAIMLAAAYDLLTESSGADVVENPSNNITEPYCNSHSTSTILLADTVPSLATKIIYPLVLLDVNPAFKALATALLAAGSFLFTGLTSNQILVFSGVVCAALSSGLGEVTFMSRCNLYGEASLSGWAMGTGVAGLLASGLYAVLRMALSTKVIMLIMLVIPVAMIIAYFYVIKLTRGDTRVLFLNYPIGPNSTLNVNISSTLSEELQQGLPIDQNGDVSGAKIYGLTVDNRGICFANQQVEEGPFNLCAKIRYLPSLTKYFMPLLIVYFSEYFINQGLTELIYYPEITYLDHAAQYRWFQVSYQIGVMVSRSTLDFMEIHSIWTMALLQAFNAIIFYAHVSQRIFIPSFYLVLAIIIYEGLLGGFTYVNAFNRVRKEVRKDRTEFCISTVAIADSLGIVIAGLLALPVHDSLCKLYE